MSRCVSLGASPNVNLLFARIQTYEHTVRWKFETKANWDVLHFNALVHASVLMLWCDTKVNDYFSIFWGVYIYSSQYISPCLRIKIPDSHQFGFKSVFF